MDKLSIKAKDPLITSSALRVLAKDYPLVASIEDLNHDQLVDMILSEEIANKANLDSESRIFYEIDCAGKRVRALSIFMMSKNGQIKSSDNEGVFSYIAPETNGERLFKLICDSPNK
jgi:hypothetical protein